MEVDVVDVTLTVGWPGAETGIGRVCPLQYTGSRISIYSYIHTEYPFLL